MSNPKRQLIAALDRSFNNVVTTLYIGYEGQTLASGDVLSVTGERATELRTLFAEADALGTLHVNKGAPELSRAPCLQCIATPITPTELPYVIEDRGPFVRNRYRVLDPEGLELCVTKDLTCAKAVWSCFLHGNELGFGLWDEKDTYRYLAKKEAMEAVVAEAVKEAKEANPNWRAYYLAAPGNNQCRLVFKEFDAPQPKVLQDYQRMPDTWKEVGLINYRGQLVASDCSSAINCKLMEAEPIAGGSYLEFNEEEHGK